MRLLTRALSRPSPFLLNSTPLLARSFATTQARALSRIQIIGRLAADPEVTMTASGQQLVKYAVGVGSGPPDNRKTSWYKITYFSRGEEDLTEKRLLGAGKGSLVFVEGDCRMNPYEGNDGKTHNALNIIHRSFEMLKRSESAEAGSRGLHEGQTGASEVASA